MLAADWTALLLGTHCGGTHIVFQDRFLRMFTAPC